jgi:hypothetical protein
MSVFRHVLRISIAAALAAGGALGCATVEDQALMFKETQKRYTHLIRFTDFERAGRFVAPDDRVAFRERTAALGDVRFTEFEISEIENLGDTATARVTYTGYRYSNPVIATFVEEQEWSRENGAWIVRPVLSEHTP